MENTTNEEAQQDEAAQLKPSKELSVGEKLEKAQLYKEEGNVLYKDKQMKSAMGKYHRCLLFVRGAEEHSRPGNIFVPEPGQKLPPELQRQADKLKVDCYNNLAACLLQLKDSDLQRVISYCDKVLDLCPNNAKAMYRKGVAYYNLKDFDSALFTLQKAKQTQKSGIGSNVLGGGVHE